ncbi:MAG: beta-ketoacyl-[acyl-carrier-protein] synthase II, partial [Candidatus Omnitrophica bacterium]|nr:beta-ketoacyl-[acyl-carrier-protein] synthase II [Candidatus Omnitrophota bacterium]
VRAIEIALADAKVNKEEIDYISLDGLALNDWDASEVSAIKQVFGKRSEKIPVSCPKSAFGNLLGASGALDLIITVLSMEHNLIAPTLNLEDPDLDGLNYVQGQAKEYPVNKALVISRGRGGINSVLVVERGEKQ